MSERQSAQLISYIALAAPATRRPAQRDEAYLRPEIGFVPKWYTDRCGIDFGQRWHTDPAYRTGTIEVMARETLRRFGPRARIGPLQDPKSPRDFITGVFGSVFVPALYGVPVIFKSDDWPWCESGTHLDDDQIRTIEPPDLDESPLWAGFIEQLDWIDDQLGSLVGYMNWQSVINTGYRLRGEQLFLDMTVDEGLVRHLFDCIIETMIDGARRLYARQAASSVTNAHFTVSNCLVNMLSPEYYRTFVYPYDVRIVGEFDGIGIHNCAWNADPYVADYATVPDVTYVDMGIESDLEAARELFPATRRSLMYTPMDLSSRSSEQLHDDLDHIARDYGPCDLVFADIDSNVPDQRVMEVIDLCEELSEAYAP